ncbi:unnamed protein product [Rhizophagus irregularis]|nr:unnamed protein product [Rhizophagus irregularis]
MKPKNRRDHTATYINDKLYILGGTHLYTDGNFFYHDFSVKFNTKNLAWQDLSNIKSVPPIHYGAASARGGETNNTLFLYGGIEYDPKMALVYTFDSQNEIWSVPEIKVPDISVNVTRKNFLTGIVDYNGKMYLWGGRLVENNNLFILDTIKLRWKNGSLINAPISRFSYGATLLSNQNIIYMGGFRLGDELPLNEVYIYDTINNNWSTKITSGTIPSNRSDFSVVLGLDGQRIILFGGDDVRNLEIYDSLYVLNLNNFEWHIPKISGQIPKNRYGHQANVIGKYIVITFGNRFGINDVNKVDYDPLDGGDILLLDISNNDEYVWTNEFEPLSLSSSATTTSPSTIAISPSATATSLSPFNNSQQSNKSSLSAANIAGAVVGTLFGGILLLLGCFFLYKWNHKRNESLTLGSENRGYIFTRGNNKGQEMAQLPINNNYIQHGKEVFHHGKEVLQAPSNESTTNHELLTISDLKDEHNKKLSLQDIDDDALQYLKNEMLQSLKQEIIQNLQNNGQASSSNITKSV